MAPQKLFRPTPTQHRVLREAEERGLTRIEVSMSVAEPDQEEVFWQKGFPGQAYSIINAVKASLDQVTSIEEDLSGVSLCYRLPIKELLGHFEHHAKRTQLYVELPLVRAMLYAKNTKRSSWCGFMQNTHQRSSKRETFLAKYMLPGPGSRVCCLLK